MNNPVSVPAPIPADDFSSSIKVLQTYTSVSEAGNHFFKGSAVTQFSDLDCAFVPAGQSDTGVRDDVRSLLRASNVAPVADALRTSFARRSAIHAQDRQSFGLAFLDFPDAAGRAGTEAGLAPILAYWLRLTAYCVVVAYGPTGAPLPPFPRTPREERQLPEQRPACVDLAFVPGNEPERWFGDDEEVGSGLPDAEHDPDDPKSSGWRA